jgi:hypothetical protein
MYIYKSKGKSSNHWEVGITLSPPRFKSPMRHLTHCDKERMVDSLQEWHTPHGCVFIQLDPLYVISYWYIFFVICWIYSWIIVVVNWFYLGPGLDHSNDLTISHG